MSKPKETLLITVTGEDRPGVTTALLASVAPFGFPVLDVEQVVIRGRLVWCLLADVAGREPAERAAASESVAAAADDLGLNCKIKTGAAEIEERRANRLIVTVIGNPLHAEAMSEIAAGIASLQGNIDRISRTASYPVTALELEVSGANEDSLRLVLSAVASQVGVDLSVQHPGLSRRGARLVVMDVDSTLIREEVIEMLAAHAGVEEAVAEITERAMRGEIDFAESLTERVALLRGVPVSAIDDVRRDVRLTPGARTLCRTLLHLGYQVALVSGGFHEVVDPLAAELGIGNVRANRLEVEDGKLTGRTYGPIIDRAGKARALEDFARDHNVPLDRTVAVGDGANDLDMLARAGLGIAFNAKPLVRSQADTGLNVPYLDSVLYLLGIPREEIEMDDPDKAFPDLDAPPV